MKSSLSDEIKELIAQGINWGKLEVEYIKFTAAEKFIVLASTMIIGAIILLFLLPVIMLLLLALADVFKLIMAPALAYLCVCGIVMICLALLYVFRTQLIVNPVSRFMTKLLIENHKKNH